MKTSPRIQRGPTLAGRSIPRNPLRQRVCPASDSCTKEIKAISGEVCIHVHRQADMHTCARTHTHTHPEMRQQTCKTYSLAVSTKSVPLSVKAMSGRELIFEQSKMYCREQNKSLSEYRPEIAPPGNDVHCRILYFLTTFGMPSYNVNTNTRHYRYSNEYVDSYVWRRGASLVTWSKL